MNRKETESKQTKQAKQTKQKITGIVSSKKGFVICDPSYVLSESVYDDFWGKHKNFDNGIFDYEGSSFAVAGTAYGDGVYYDNHARKYPVDAGVIALIPLELVGDENGIEGIELGEFVINELGLFLGTVFNIPGEAEFTCEDGVFDITFSDGYHVHINTDVTNNAEDDDDDDTAEDNSDNRNNCDHCDHCGEDCWEDYCEDCDEDCAYCDYYDECEHRMSLEDYAYGEYDESDGYYHNDPDDDDYEE